jgi:glycosyltransferase involved in cell wall biosynthesis
MRARVLFVSGRETGYIRNRMVLKALRSAYEVTVLTPDTRSTPARLLGGAARLLTCHAPHEFCFAGFYGQPLALAASITQRAPVILDAFVSTYDTLCEDRRTFSPRSPAGRLAFWLDEAGCRRAARVLADTEANAEYLARTFRVPRDKLAALPVGCDEVVFSPRPMERAASRFEVFHYGAFLGLHGTDVIVRAAALLRDCRGIHFTLGGDGPLRRDVVALAEELGLDNVSLPGWIPFERLPDHIARADVCLGGHFSTNPKAQRVVATKTYQFIAMARPTIVGDNVASREAFAPREHVLAVTMGDPEALARAIVELRDDAALRERLASAGYILFQERYSSIAIGRRLTRIVDEVLTEHRGQP